MEPSWIEGQVTKLPHQHINSYTASAEQQHLKAKMRLPMRGVGWRGLHRTGHIGVGVLGAVSVSRLNHLPSFKEASILTTANLVLEPLASRRLPQQYLML